MCAWIQLPTLIPVDTPFAVSAFADTSLHASESIDSPYAVPLVLRTKGTGTLAVRVVSKTQGQSRDLYLDVSQSLALELGLTDEQFNIWTEMEMVAFSILLNCRKYARRFHPLTSCTDCRNRCQRSMFVARDEHDDVSVIACPLPDCDHIWCKLCQQSIDLNGPAHSCDGTSELDHLVKEQGWKYCPSESQPPRAHLPS